MSSVNAQNPSGHRGLRARSCSAYPSRRGGGTSHGGSSFIDATGTIKLPHADIIIMCILVGEVPSYSCDKMKAPVHCTLYTLFWTEKCLDLDTASASTLFSFLSPHLHVHLRAVLAVLRKLDPRTLDLPAHILYMICPYAYP